MIDKDLATLTDEELMELLVSLEAIDFTLAEETGTSGEGDSNDETK